MESSSTLSTFPLHWIPLLPLLGAAINLIVGRHFSKRWVHLISCGSVLASLVVVMVGVFYFLYPQWASWVAIHGHSAAANIPRPMLTDVPFDWIVAGQVNIALGFLLDPLSAVMVLVVSFVGFLIHVYSTGYMADERDSARFFGYMNLFTGAMLILVLGDSLPVLFVGWEGVGLCSYLLIGFWYDKSGTAKFGEENATAGKKAFIVNRIGDLAFIIGMFVLFGAAGTLNIEQLAQNTQALTSQFTLTATGWTVSVAGLAGLMLFVGACGKSAQIPLYVWLPDAMAGPTPVSALIHAATMVTAGVYMVARMNFMYMLTPDVMGLIALVGAFTAFFAATIGLAQNDIKKVLAYSTVSQLGYMFLGAGVAAFGAGVFHLFTHAFFKACLFLCAGAVIHSLAGEQDIRKMGGLRKTLPLTHLTFLLSTLAIAGLPIFSGFFSKDEILWRAISVMPNGTFWNPWLAKLVYVMALAGAICTAFYMFRLYYLTFSGESRTPEENMKKFHPPPPAMTTPLLVLAIGASVVGFLGVPEALPPNKNVFHNWLEPVVERGAVLSGALEPAHAAEGEKAAHALPVPPKEVRELFAESGIEPIQRHPTIAHNHGMEFGLMGLSVLVALFGWFAARKAYKTGPSPGINKFCEKYPNLHKAVKNKWYVDEIYHFLIIRPFKGIAMLFFKLADRFFIDILGVNGTAAVVSTCGRALRWIQNGNVQHYVAVLVLGIVMVLYWASTPPDAFTVTNDGAVDVNQEVIFDAGREESRDQRQLQYRWDFDGDGKWDWPPQGTGEDPDRFMPRTRATYKYAKAGKYRAVLEVRDLRWGTSAKERKTITVGKIEQGEEVR